jgi:hypothetical protein
MVRPEGELFEGFRLPNPHDWLKGNHAMKHLKALNQSALGSVIASVLAAAAHGDGFTATGSESARSCQRSADGTVPVHKVLGTPTTPVLSETEYRTP